MQATKADDRCTRLKGAVKREEMMSITSFDWIAYHAGVRGAKAAMVDLSSGRRFTYAQMHDRVERLARALQTRYAVARKDRVSVLAHNSTDLFEIQFACTRIG